MPVRRDAACDSNPTAAQPAMLHVVIDSPKSAWIEATAVCSAELSRPDRSSALSGGRRQQAGNNTWCCWIRVLASPPICQRALLASSSFRARHHTPVGCQGRPGGCGAGAVGRSIDISIAQREASRAAPPPPQRQPDAARNSNAAYEQRWRRPAALKGGPCAPRCARGPAAAN